MRLFEVDESSLASIIGILDFLKHRSADLEIPAVYDTETVINMIKHDGLYFDYAALVDANENLPAVQNIIKSLSKEEIVLHSDDEDEEIDNDQEERAHGEEGQKHVAAMAKHAANKDRTLK